MSPYFTSVLLYFLVLRDHWLKYILSVENWVPPKRVLEVCEWCCTFFIIPNVQTQSNRVCNFQIILLLWMLHTLYSVIGKVVLRWIRRAWIRDTIAYCTNRLSFRIVYCVWPPRTPVIYFRREVDTVRNTGFVKFPQQTLSYCWKRRLTQY
jgi:hypothetical protein